MNRPTYAFMSGDYQSWGYYRPIHVWKFCKKAIIRGGLAQALQRDDVLSVIVRLNDRVLESHQYKFVGDKISFKSTLRPHYKAVKKPWYKRWFVKEKFKITTTSRAYDLSIRILYDSMEPTKYDY